MRLYKQALLGTFIFFGSLFAFAGTSFNATTTLTAETANNTSAASAFTAQSNGNIAGSNISKVQVQSLLYPGATAKIFANFLPWFGFGDHMNVGYVSSDVLQVQKQVNDMASRGLDGAVIDWYGRGTFNQHFVHYDQASQAFMQQSELHAGFTFAIMHDAVALKACAAISGCDLTRTLIDDLNYANTTYLSSPSYLHFAGRPVIYFFGHEIYSIDWTRVRAGVASNPLFIFRNPSGFTKAQSGGGYSWVEPGLASSTDPMSLTYIDNYDKTALSFPTDYSTTSAYKGFNDTLASWGSNRIIGQQCGQTWLHSLAEAGKYYFATEQMFGIQLVTWNDYEEGTEVESGIDNCVTVSASASATTVSWSINGQLNTVDHFSVFASQDGENLMWLADTASTTNSLDVAQFNLPSGSYTVYVKAVGKPMMTNKMSAGVQLTVPNQPPNAVLSLSTTQGSAPVTGQLTAPISITASTAGSSDPDGSIASSIINFGDGSMPVSAVTASHTYSVAGTYTAIGTVTDNLGATASKSASVVVVNPSKPPVAAISVTPATAYGPVTVSASAAASTASSGTIVSSLINFGDGTTASGLTASHTYSATGGVYTVTATVTDSIGASSSASTLVTVKAPEVIVSSPANGASVISPVHVLASGSSGNPVIAMQIYLDWSLVFTVHSSTLDTLLPIPAGTHNLIVKGWDASGRNFSKSLNVTVTNQPPVAAVSLSTGSTLIGGMVTASASGSTAPSGSISKTVIDFGDGSSANAVTASHQYKAAGTYTVKATVTDNLGATSTATAKLTVKPQFVTITSPTFTTTSTSSIHVTGAAFSGYRVVATQVYVDGALKYQSTTNLADVILPLTVGTHGITVQGWDSSGATFKSWLPVTRQ